MFLRKMCNNKLCVAAQLATTLLIISVIITEVAESQSLQRLFIQAHSKEDSLESSNLNNNPQRQIAASRQVASTQLKQSTNNLSSVRQRWRQLEHSVGESLISLSGSFKAAFEELASNKNLSISRQCSSALRDLVDGLKDQQLWATQMIDSSAHLPSGLLEGTLTELGHFDQCLSLRHRSTSGQYCSIQVKPPLTLRPRLHTVCQRLPALSASAGANQTIGSNSNSSSFASPFRVLSQNSHQFYYVGLRLGICTPSRCSQSDVQLLLSSYLTKYALVGQVKSCQAQQVEQTTAERLDTIQVAIVSTFALLLLLSAIGTLVDALSTDSSSSKSLECRLNDDQETNNKHAISQLGRWQNYQIYRSQIQSRCELHEQASSVGTQFNPLVAQTKQIEEPAFGYGENGSKSNSCKPVELADLLLHSKQAATDEGESWIERLERNEQLEESRLGKNSVSERDNVRVESRFIQLLSSFLICFSVRRNLQTIGKYASNNNNSNNGNNFNSQRQMGDIKVVHGLRTFTMIWIIFGHTIGLVSPEMMNNLFSLAQLSCSSRFLQALLNATLAVNTFFMISGLVTVMSFARKCKSALALIAPKPAHRRKSSSATQYSDPELSSVNSSLSVLSSSALSSSDISSRSGARLAKRSSPSKQRKSMDASNKWWPSDFQPLLWLLMRYLRLTPAYAAIIGVSIVLPALGSGPFWFESIGQMGPTCRRNWWTNLSYLNNFIETDKLCLIHSWYLSNDWLFFILSLILFGLFYKSRKITLLFIITLIIGNSAATFAITVANEFPPTIVTTSPAIAERWLFIHSLYYKPWPHLTSYLIGLIVGYLILIKDRLNMSSSLRTLAWLLFSLLAFTLLNSIYPWNMGLQVDPMLTGLHSATFRSLWAACCGWLVFALVTRPQNPLAKLLSWHGFQVTSRLTYCTYLVHPLIIYYHFGSLRERMDSSMYGQLHRFIATLGLSYLFALLLSLLVESPSIQLQHFLSGLRGSQAKKRPRRYGSESSTAHSWTVKGSTMGSSLVLTPNEAAEVEARNQLLDQRGLLNLDSSQGKSIAMENNEKDSIALDGEFQRKLAQAISKGFRLRSRIANETNIKQVYGPLRRATQVKGLPLGSGSNQQELMRSCTTTKIEKQPEAVARQLSTFTAPPTSVSAIKNRPKETSTGFNLMLADKLGNRQDLICNGAALQQQHKAKSGTTPRETPQDLSEMILRKQRLLSQQRSQNLSYQPVSKQTSFPAEL